MFATVRERRRQKEKGPMLVRERNERRGVRRKTSAEIWIRVRDERRTGDPAECLQFLVGLALG